MDITYSAKWVLTDEQLKDVEPLIDWANSYILSELVKALEPEMLEAMGISIEGEASGKPIGLLGRAD